MAFWLDVASVGIPIVFLWAMGQLAGVGSVWLAVTLLAVSFVAYTAISMWLAGGATVGKAVCGLAVRRVDGSPVATSGRSLVWSVGRQSAGYVVVDILGLGTLVAIVDGRRRALHDLGFASQVVTLDEVEGMPARRRLEKYSEQVETALENLRREYRWLLFLWKWLTKVVLLALMWLLTFTRLGAWIHRSLSPTKTPAATGAAPSPGAVAGIWVATAALTTGAVLAGGTVIRPDEDQDQQATTSETAPPSDPGGAADEEVPSAAGDTEIVGTWGVDRPPEEAEYFGDHIFEIRAGPAPALFTGAFVTEASDCPPWGAMQLDEAADPTEPLLTAPSNTGMQAAWSGTLRFSCLESQDEVYDVLVGLLPRGELVMVIPDMESLVPGWPEDLGRTIFFSRRDR